MVSENHFLPLLIDMSDKKIVIFGGGSVGERKALLFSPHADVTVISRDFTPILQEAGESGNLILVIEDANTLSDENIAEFIEGSFLVIPATNERSINEKIVTVAKQKEILTNQVDAIGDVTVPSVIKRGDLTISISTSGSSPAFSRYTRQKVEKVITPQFADMIRIQDAIRSYLKENVPEQRERKDILWQILDSKEVWSALGESYEKGFKTAQDIVMKISEKV
ncbi:bifunctional precorrin-2 dehydrogenase/sirohydrochlorin ferrochelatase [Methanolobus sp. ZRKC3]|uniref:precorrin-2 dehydrogenase/sirohydrochlorin ferrochelatase family protein n=1 Tax=Methanolobus sp. ZRKC3 TaxID=3125786 RepID=UPI00324F3FE7